MHFLLVIHFGCIFQRFPDMASFPLKTHIFLPLHSTPNLKMFPCTALAKFCTQRTRHLLIRPIFVQKVLFFS